MQLVNGYPCHNCVEAELAQKGIDPAHPQETPEKRKVERAEKEGLHPPTAMGKNEPLAFGSTGTRLNIAG